MPLQCVKRTSLPGKPIFFATFFTDAVRGDRTIYRPRPALFQVGAENAMDKVGLEPYTWSSADGTA